MKKRLTIISVILFFCFTAKAQEEGKCVSGNCVNGIGTYVYVSKTGETLATYKGSFKDSKFDGKGSFTTTIGTYTGEFKNDLMEGSGTLIFKNGKKATGIWKEGQLWAGTGYFEIKENDSYEGGVKDNQPEGQGVHIFSNGDKYEGNFKDGKFDGYGVYKYKDGSKYKGNWTDGKKNGMGSQYDDAGNIDYDDDWTNGKMTHPERSASYKKDMWEESKKAFSRVTFKGTMPQTIMGQDGVIEIINEFHLNSDYSLYGTIESIVKIDNVKYRFKINITGTYYPLTRKIHTEPGSTIYEDELPEDLQLKWLTPDTGDETLYAYGAHPGYYIIEGKTSSGKEYSITDYY